MQIQVIAWLMQPDPTGTVLPDLASLIQRPRSGSPEPLAGGVARLPTSRPEALPQSTPALSVTPVWYVINASTPPWPTGPSGVWGGASARERAAMRRAVA